MLITGAISGGAGAVLAGENFWQGAMSGFFVMAFNHLEHKIDNKDDPKPKPKKQKLSSKEIKGAAKIVKDVGLSAGLIEAIDKTFGTNAKIFGKFGNVGTYLAAGGQIIYDGVEYYEGQISGYRLSFRMGTTVTSAVAGAEVGAALGGPYGFVVGATISFGATTTEQAWDAWWPQFQQGVNRFRNTIINSFMLSH